MTRFRGVAPLAILLLAACGGSDPGDLTATGDVDRYTVRGRVMQLPDPQRPGSEFQVHHEAIPDFRDIDGEVVGMDSMIMPFPVADPALLDGVEVGDEVEFDFEMRWRGSPPIRVTRIEELPADTLLGFEAPAPEPAPDPDAETAAEG